MCCVLFLTFFFSLQMFVLLHLSKRRLRTQMQNPSRRALVSGSLVSVRRPSVPETLTWGQAQRGSHCREHMERWDAAPGPGASVFTFYFPISNCLGSMLFPGSLRKEGLSVSVCGPTAPRGRARHYLRAQKASGGRGACARGDPRALPAACELQVPCLDQRGGRGSRQRRTGHSTTYTMPSGTLV